MGNTLLYVLQTERSNLSLSFYNYLLNASLLLLLAFKLFTMPVFSRLLLLVNLSYFYLISFFLRLGFRFSIVIVSIIRSYLTFLSSGLSVAKEARLLTSISHGLTRSSRNISNPSTSKHCEFSISSGRAAL